jgi:hypothetical protein
LGTFLRNPPLLQHTGTGQFTITNADTRKRSVEYAVFTGAGEIVSGATITNNVVDMGNIFGEYYVAYSTDTQLKRAAKFNRAQITYRTESTTSCTDNCGIPYDCVGSPVPNCRPCWGSSDDGTYCCGGICCGGSRGQTCNTTTRQVKNAVPSGYTERYGEWVRINNPETRGSETPEITVDDSVGFSLMQVEWPEGYYQSRPLPKPHPAEVYDEETGAPTGEVLENVPAWDYTDIFFIYYDTNGDVVWTRDNVSNRECFTVVQNKLMEDYEIWVSNLPAAGAGTYEFVICNDTEEFFREEGNV